MTEPAAPQPAAPVAPAAPPPAPATPPAAADADPNSPAWLPERLARSEQAAREALLKELGVDDPVKAKKALADARKAEEDQKTAADHAAEAKLEAKKATSEADRLRKIAQEHAARMIAVLTPEQQKAVTDLAGDDPAEQLKAIGVLGPIWAKQAPAAPLPGPAPAATTAPPPTAPPAASPGSPPDHKQVFTTLSERNPFEAAAYGLSHPAEVFDIKS